jgi:hypothetical protein
VSAEGRQRVEQLLRGVRRIADPSDPLGRRARKVLPEATGLSPEGVELALSRHLETTPSADELDALVHSVTPAARAHVLLSANVFVAAHRAIALALAQSAEVEVRASRREPEMAKLIAEATDNLFRLVDQLTPRPGDHVWAYGSDETLHALRAELPAGVVYHAHGHGFGVAVVDASAGVEPARALADDVIAFDQRGCLSPRVTLVLGDANAARAFAQALAHELGELEQIVPRGRLDPDEAADIVRYRDTMLYAASVSSAGKSYVGVDVSGRHALVAPVGRTMHVVRVDDLAPVFAAFHPHVAAIGYAGPSQPAFPSVRVSPLGQMQRPPFDGPVDLRPPAQKL